MRYRASRGAWHHIWERTDRRGNGHAHGSQHLACHPLQRSAEEVPVRPITHLHLSEGREIPADVSPFLPPVPCGQAAAEFVHSGTGVPPRNIPVQFHADQPILAHRVILALGTQIGRFLSFGQVDRQPIALGEEYCLGSWAITLVHQDIQVTERQELRMSGGIA
jgi:hypothetical protein